MSESNLADREIVQERLLNAPRELVFDVWTDPAHINEWWGPRGFTTTTHEIDVRPGGVWRFIMHGPDGTDYKNRVVYREVVRPERLVWEHDSDIDDDPMGFNVTVTFDQQDGRTKMTMRTVLRTVEACEAVKAFGAVELGRETIDKLEEYLQSRR